jgi:hypothetical protein
MIRSALFFSCLEIDMNKLSDVDWEIDQILLAIEYYEKAVTESTNSYDALKYEECINSLKKYLLFLRDEVSKSERKS